MRFVIIGGGPAGNTAATVAASLGAEVTMIERDIVGGAAHLCDCIPSKAMIATGNALAELSHLGADVPVGDGVLARPVDRDHSPVLHRDGEAARVGTIERTRRLDDRRRPSEDSFARRGIEFSRLMRHTVTISDEPETENPEPEREPEP